MSAICDNNHLIYIWELQVTVNDTNTTEFILVSNFRIMYCAICIFISYRDCKLGTVSDLQNIIIYLNLIELLKTEDSQINIFISCFSLKIEALVTPGQRPMYLITRGPSLCFFCRAQPRCPHAGPRPPPAWSVQRPLLWLLVFAAPWWHHNLEGP